MKKFFTLLFGCVICSSYAQQSYTIFDHVIYYDGYAATVSEPVPDGVVRINNARYTTKLSPTIIEAVSSGSLTMDVTVGALCDDYDRIGEIFLALVPKGSETYNSDEVDRIEIARIITPFMNKNKQPDEVPYHFTVDNLSEIFKDVNLQSQFDFWIEFELFGVPYAANTEVAGCSGRNDVFEGTLVFNTNQGNYTYSNAHFFEPLADYENLNNYNATDVPGETTKIISFHLDQSVNDVVLYLITSNHGANSQGEEYNRRIHNIYLDDELIFSYKPGGKSCEPYRIYNTMGNGIYGFSVQSTREWLSSSNWCPGDAIPNREISLGNISAGDHTIKLDVPDAVFNQGQGNIPVSMYLQNRLSGQPICDDPSNLSITEQIGNTVYLDWTENGDATAWEFLYGRSGTYTDNFADASNDGETGGSISNLTNNWFYDVFVRSKCDENNNSMWVGPVKTAKILNTKDENLKSITLYPNPANDLLSIEANSIIQSVRLFDMSGNLLKTGSEKTLNLSKLPSGNYLVEVKTIDGKTTTEKILKN